MQVEENANEEIDEGAQMSSSLRMMKNRLENEEKEIDDEEEAGAEPEIELMRKWKTRITTGVKTKRRL